MGKKNKNIRPEQIFIKQEEQSMIDNLNIDNNISQSENEHYRPDSRCISFDSWFSMRQNNIPLHHKKEVIRADFTARGINLISSTIEEFDLALEKYGIKINS